MNKQELITEIAYKTRLPKALIQEVIDAFIAVASRKLARGNDIRLVGFGTFTVIERKPCEGTNPRTGARIQIPAMKKPKFKAGLALTQAVNKPRRKLIDKDGVEIPIISA